MQHVYQETCRTDSDCKIRIGGSSWDENRTSVKFTWFYDKNGQQVAARGGEVPMEVLPQMLELAIRRGGLKLEIAAENGELRLVYKQHDKEKAALAFVAHDDA